MNIHCSDLFVKHIICILYPPQVWYKLTVQEQKDMKSYLSSDSGPFLKVLENTSMIWWNDLLSNCESNGPCLVKNGWVVPEILTILVIEVGQIFCQIFVVKMVQLPINFILVFMPYLSNAVELRDGSCAKMFRWTWRLQPHPQWLAIMIIAIFDIWVLVFHLL